MTRKEAIQKVFDELIAMKREEFMKFIDEHKDGDIALSLLYAGAFDDLRKETSNIIDFKKCGACCWIWETPEIKAFCRLYDDVKECEGPKNKDMYDEK